MQKARPSGIRSSRKEKRMAEFGRIRFAFFALPSLPAPPPHSLFKSIRRSSTRK